MTEESNGLKRIITRASEAIGTGVGAFVITGDTTSAVAATSGALLGAVGNEIAERGLSPRQEIRVGQVYLQASTLITTRVLSGETVRQDGFFEGPGSAGYELAEGILLVARDTFEERKLPFLGNLVGNIAFASTIDPYTANFVLRLAERLSWLDLCLIAIFDDDEQFPMPDLEQDHAPDWNSFTIMEQLRRLTETGGEQVMTFKRERPEESLLPTFDTRLSGIVLTNSGRLIAGLMELNQILRSELRPIYDQLLRPESGRSSEEKQ